MRGVVHVTRYKRNPRGRSSAVRCNFVVLTINQSKAHANIYFHQFNSEIYIWRLSRVAFSWFTALATMSGGALIFRIDASDWDARTPYIVFLAVSPCWLLWIWGSFSGSILCFCIMPIYSHCRVVSNGR